MRESLLLVVLALIINPVAGQFEEGRLCFCKGDEAVEACDCSNDRTIDSLNNQRLHEKVQSLLKRDFFRFYKVNFSFN